MRRSPPLPGSTRVQTSREVPSLTIAATLLFLLTLLLFGSVLQAQQVPVAVLTERPGPATSLDAGPLPDSQPMTLTVRLALDPRQETDLASLLEAQTDPASPSFHRWLTPQQYGDRFGASPDEIANLTTWLQQRGLAVTPVAPSRGRLTVTGSAAAVGAAFQTGLRRLAVDGQVHFSATGGVSLPGGVASLIASVSGLDDLAPAHPTSISSPGHVPTPGAEPLVALEELVDRNSAPMATIATGVCLADLPSATLQAYRTVLRQANAQGITVLGTSDCASGTEGSFAASLPEVTALATAPMEAQRALSIDPRPLWQAAPGLDNARVRQQPDLTTSSIAAFGQALSAILSKTGERQGNINRHLYALAPTPGLFTQPGTSEPVPGSWQPATGLGVVDLDRMVKAWGTGVLATTTSLVATGYSVSWGQSLTLTAQVVPPTGASSAPSGTVTFSSAAGMLGSSTVDATGYATLQTTTLPVGTYSFVATYSGDASFAASASTSRVIVTVSVANATLTAQVSPATKVPYGANATVTATVTLPNSSATPTGPGSAQILGVSGMAFSANLIPNPGGNSATANIAVAAPPTGTYGISVTCTGNANFQCQTPVNLTLSSTKGNSSTTISVSPTVPSAGQPATLLATIANAGDAPGAYVFGGSLSFFDNGKLLATAPVAANQATVTQSLSGDRTHNLTAVYTGDYNWNGSTSSVAAITPSLLPSSLTLSSNAVSGSTSLAGANLILTASASTSAAASPSGPTGTVTFFDTFNGSVVQLGSPSATVPNGPNAAIAIFSTTGLAPGKHSLYATFSGDSNFAATTSPVLALVIGDFSLSLEPAAMTLAAGSSGTANLLLNSAGGFAGTVVLGCTPPASSQATCSFSPASLTPGSASALTIQTTAATKAAARQPAETGRPGAWRLAPGLSLASLLLLAVPRKRLRLATRLLLCLLTVGLVSASGCGVLATNVAQDGSSQMPAGAPSGTPLGVQTFTITAAASNGAGSSRHTYQYQVTVE